MAQEAFLINPPKQLRKRRHNPIGEVLVTVGANPRRRNPMKRRRRNPENPWFGDPNGHRIAALMRWGKLPRGHVKRYRKRGRPHVSLIKKHVVKKSHVKRKRVHRKISPRVLAGMRSYMSALPVGAYRPGRKAFGHNPLRRFVKMARRRKAKKNTWFGQPRRHRKAAKLGWRRGHAGVKRRKHRRNYFTNPAMSVGSNPRRRHRKSGRKHNVARRHRRSSYRRNPAIDFGRFTSGIANIRGWAPLAVTGGLSAITGSVVPGMVGVVNPWAKLGVQLAVAVGGGMLVEKAVDKRHGEAWMIVGVSMVGYQLLKQFVFIPYFPQFAVGLGAYESYYPVSQYNAADMVSQQVGAFPSEVHAFPSEMHGYPGVGAMQEEVGSYPYDGSGY